MSTDVQKRQGTNGSRRGFLKLAIAALNGLLAVALAVPGLGYLLTPVFRKSGTIWVKLGPADRFQAPQPQKAVYKYVAQSGYTRKKKSAFVWVVASSDESDPVRVLSAVCTHTGCNVAWDAGEQKFVCPCHGGRYDIRGRVLSGPPPRPLSRLPVKLEDGQLAIQIST